MMKNKTRFLIAASLLTLLFVFYLTWSESGNFAFSYPHSEAAVKKRWQNPKNDNVNELLPITRSTHPLRQEFVYESEIPTRVSISSNRINQNKNVPSMNNINVDENQVQHWKYGNSQNDKLLSSWGTIRTDGDKNDIFAHGHKLVHLDLKGAPPLISYLKQIFPLFQRLGVTGLLIEYEDMFPYWGSLRELSALNAYSIQNIKTLLQLATKHKFEVIPLIQTFGHMEFVLKHRSFAHLREITMYPQVICPTQNDTMTLIGMMIDQVMALHPHSRWIHIGSDEVYYIGNCNYCQNKMTAFNWDKDQLFLDHAQAVAKYVKSKHNIQPIMWDDMFRQIPDGVIQSSGIAKHIEIMAWRYGKDVLSELPPEIWTKYSKLFTGVWVASAFKGATGPSQYITQISTHLENHVSWMKTLQDYGQNLKFKGIALTGWQRYDHFAVLCELLPAAIPSLAINLLFLQMKTVETSLISRATHVLDCAQPISLDFDTSIINRCNFPGSRVYEGVQQLYNIHQELQVIENDNHITGWLNQYNIDVRFSSPALVETAHQKVQELKRNLSLLRDDMEHILPLVFDEHTVAEWLHLHLSPLEKKSDYWLNAASTLMLQEFWPRRPFTYNKTSHKSFSNSRDTL